MNRIVLGILKKKLIEFLERSDELLEHEEIKDIEPRDFSINGYVIRGRLCIDVMVDDEPFFSIDLYGRNDVIEPLKKEFLKFDWVEERGDKSEIGEKDLNVQEPQKGRRCKK